MKHEPRSFLQHDNDGEESEQEIRQHSGRYEEVLDIFERYSISAKIREAYFKWSGMELDSEK
jgi:hypothetical protein